MKRWLRKSPDPKDEGSMVVEAALILPVFLLFVLFLIFIIQMTLYSTALQSTASDTVKIISSHMYPAALAMQQQEGEVERKPEKQVRLSTQVMRTPPASGAYRACR